VADLLERDSVAVAAVTAVRACDVIERLAVEVSAESVQPLEVGPDGLQGQREAPVFNVHPEKSAAREVDLWVKSFSAQWQLGIENFDEKQS